MSITTRMNRSDKNERILFIENYASINAVSFYLSAAKAAAECGMEFHIAYNAPDRDDAAIASLLDDYGVHFHQIDFARSPFRFQNLKAIWQVRRLVKERGIKYIHCNTPIGGVAGRLAGLEACVERVIYQAHGFHFYHGGPWYNWALFFPAEVVMAKLTDAIITINHYDYEIASRFLSPRKGGCVYYVPGVGIDLSRFCPDPQRRLTLRRELGIEPDSIVLSVTGELSCNKNQIALLRALRALSNEKLVVLLCGVGPKEAALQKYAEEYLQNHDIRFLSFRNDIPCLLQATDLFVSVSKREGLSRSIMEAMASGLPCVVSNARGNADLIVEGRGGFICAHDDDAAIAASIKSLVCDPQLRTRMGNFNLKRVKEFDLGEVVGALRRLYEAELTVGHEGE